MNDFEKIAQIATKIHSDCTLIKFWQLEGGISAAVTALEIKRADGTIVKMIIRQHGSGDLAGNLDVALLEYNLLKIMKSAGLPVPDAYLVDQSGDIFPTPYVVIEFMDGATDLTPPNPVERAAQLAEVLSRIHAVDCSTLDVSFLVKKAAKIHRKLSRVPDKLDDTMHEQHVREVLSAVWPLPAINEQVILHGDFWPGNVLWRDGEISAVIDWENGEFGDPLADFANARLEILLLFGPEAMHDFAQTYLSHNPVDLTHLPYWELVAALRTASQITAWGFDAATETLIIETRREFVEQTLQRIPRSI